MALFGDSGVKPVIAVFVGGVLGTGARLGLDTLIPHTDSTFPWSTLLINVVGSFALGVLVARSWDRLPAWGRAGLGPGVIGSFTTFSAIMVSLVTLAENDEPVLAGVYLVASLVLGFAAAGLGIWVGRPPGSAAPDLAVDE